MVIANWAPMDWLTRKQAALYLSSLGCKISVQSLANKASNNNAGGGPSFTRHGWNLVFYQRKDLDVWAQSRIVRVA